MHPSFTVSALVLAAGAITGGCFGECGGDSCPVVTYVAGRVTSADGNPVAGLRVEAQTASLVPGSGCDTTTMQSWSDAQTGSTGSYVIGINLAGFDEVDCSFLRIGALGNPGFAWNDTLVGPLVLGEFGAEPPDTSQVDIVLQAAVPASKR